MTSVDSSKILPLKKSPTRQHVRQKPMCQKQPKKEAITSRFVNEDDELDSNEEVSECQI
jgi:hypothetical protein